MAVYYGAVEANSPKGKIVHDPALARFLLFSLCFSLNMGGGGTPSAGGRNVIMMGIFTEYGIPISYSGWMKYGWPLVPLIGPIVVPMGIMTQIPGEPWASGLAVALASSFAHFLVVGSPTNALTFALGTYPDTGERVIQTIDFVKYGFGLFILSMLLLWLVGFLLVFPIVGFPEGILDTATQVLQSRAG
ncbi:MAG: hypothetical protein GY729_03210 [Desulfobacteraceae bacterium]|nr:hypothetical protein [Desulfobacteraceae bacterium]